MVWIRLRNISPDGGGYWPETPVKISVKHAKNISATLTNIFPSWNVNRLMRKDGQPGVQFCKLKFMSGQVDLNIIIIKGMYHLWIRIETSYERLGIRLHWTFSSFFRSIYWFFDIQFSHFIAEIKWCSAYSGLTTFLCFNFEIRILEMYQYFVFPSTLFVFLHKTFGFFSAFWLFTAFENVFQIKSKQQNYLELSGITALNLT